MGQDLLLGLAVCEGYYKHEVINMGALADVEITMHYTPSEQLVITRFLMPKDCANIYGHFTWLLTHFGLLLDLISIIIYIL